MSSESQVPAGKDGKPSMRSALARLGLPPFTEPASGEEAWRPCFTRAQARRLTEDLCAKAQLRVGEDVERYLAQLFCKLPYVDGDALDVLDKMQDEFLGSLEKDAQDAGSRTSADQVSDKPDAEKDHGRFLNKVMDAGLRRPSASWPSRLPSSRSHLSPLLPLFLPSTDNPYNNRHTIRKTI